MESMGLPVTWVKTIFWSLNLICTIYGSPSPQEWRNRNLFYQFMLISLRITKLGLSAGRRLSPFGGNSTVTSRTWRHGWRMRRRFLKLHPGKMSSVPRKRSKRWLVGQKMGGRKEVCFRRRARRAQFKVVHFLCGVFSSRTIYRVNVVVCIYVRLSVSLGVQWRYSWVL